MSDWTNEEIGELVRLWPTASAAQIARRLHRAVGAVSGKASRLRHEGLLPAGGVAKQYDVKPWRARSQLAQMRQLKSAPAKPTPPVNDVLDMRPCSILELDATRCHWPLGDIEEVAVQYCGGVAVPGRGYCVHHWRRARGKVA